MIYKIAATLIDTDLSVKQSLDLAIKILEALREPSPDMIKRGEGCIRCGFGAKYVWSDMIDVALGVKKDV